MTGKDLVYKPRVVERAKFEYSPLGKAFNKELVEKGKKEGSLKTLKNIEDINKKQFKKQLKPIENNKNNANSRGLKN